MGKILSFTEFRTEILDDYKVAVASRECSLLGRREVLSGRGKFGIFGDGKELPQIAMAKAFKNGDFRSGYYRDQTFMMAIGVLTLEHFFAALYGHADINFEPMSGGRQMGGHFLTHSLDQNGNWLDMTKQPNSSADISCTAGQMPRLLGLAQASKIYRENKSINAEFFSDQGNEVAWGTIGDASTSEGVFFETINAAGVMQVPMVISVWDDSYGISVPKKYQTTKESISEVLQGFKKTNTDSGIEIFKVKGWDYAELVRVYQEAGKTAREQHIPILIHVEELTQQQGHSTSGSHERYKDRKRLKWEQEKDCNLALRNWILDNKIANEKELKEIEQRIQTLVKEAKNKAWNNYISELKYDQEVVLSLIDKVYEDSHNKAFITQKTDALKNIKAPTRKDILSAGRNVLYITNREKTPAYFDLKNWLAQYLNKMQEKYSAFLYSESKYSPLNISPIPPSYNENAEQVDGRVILRENFDALLKAYPQLHIFGEDCGKIGDVNQGLEGLQSKYGLERVSDTGIREATIVGQAIGMAMRGLKPIAEIQYLDYLTYALYTLSDDLACLHYRSSGRQKAPLIVRTRGHRLEGIFHAGSPIGGIINYVRGMYVLTPRNMTQAAGFYNTMLASDQPALIIESLNGYRIKEPIPNNLGQFKVQPGIVEVMKEGTDITVVSYGSTLRIVEKVALKLLQMDISLEVIDCQSILPFDTQHDIAKSVRKTNRLLIVDEDLPGGASAYILQQLIDEQKIFNALDCPPHTMSSKPHRTAYGTDGDYFSKPNEEDIFEKVVEIMNEVNPRAFPDIGLAPPF
ncbi:pyruvate/2-oxoglutarate dehydrogenase complex, dehydrogenase component beta subunit [Elysia marginata]|uniref:3-methyl-2-oxobutanoate dehydrogenase (2-methylpropanoyl-transferring) n=1 Tax=Elysia marginata TaxID=1093978 RepID=A0AAV4FWR7_9GAST|nr:pyruvate/2-oxoglutarate dehydrogenase complex, dehydrogenase component beta subunit [Elysia marginata]